VAAKRCASILVRIVISISRAADGISLDGDGAAGKRAGGIFKGITLTLTLTLTSKGHAHPNPSPSPSPSPSPNPNFKGMLTRKPGITKIQLAPSMHKVPG
jgi:hypothetical protein